MGGKKKGGDKKKAPKAKGAVDENDQSMENFWKFYKKKCVELGIDILKPIKKKMDAYAEDPGDTMRTLHIWEELGWPGTKAITDCLIQANFPHLVSIRFWKTYCEDEGVRAICEFLVTCASI